MTPQPVIYIPKPVWPDIATLLSISVPTLRKLAKCVSSSTSTPDVADLAECCARAIRISETEGESVLTVAFNMSHLSRTLDVPPIKLLPMFGKALELAGFTDWDSGQSNAFDQRTKPLSDLIALDGPIDTMSKARELLFEAQ